MLYPGNWYIVARILIAVLQLISKCLVGASGGRVQLESDLPVRCVGLDRKIVLPIPEPSGTLCSQAKHFTFRCSIPLSWQYAIGLIRHRVNTPWKSRNRSLCVSVTSGDNLYFFLPTENIFQFSILDAPIFGDT